MQRYSGRTLAQPDGVRSFGADNRAVLDGSLGFTHEEVEAAFNDGTVGSTLLDAPEPASTSLQRLLETRMITPRDSDDAHKLGLARWNRASGTVRAG